MKKRDILLIITLAFSIMAAKATPVDVTTAERVARNFWNASHDKDVTAISQPMELVSTRWDAFYLFHAVETQGFVIVAADDRIQPILAYSFHNRAMSDSVGPEMAWWLDGWQQQIDWCRNSRTTPDATVTAEWQRYSEENDPMNDPIVVVEPLLTTQWDQDEPYNDSCPTQSMWGGYYTVGAATGCVATAMAQVMKYWNYPEQGYGSHSYYSDVLDSRAQPFGNQYANFGATTYDWAHMPDRLTNSSSQQEKRAVATLMYHCGVASDMIYGSAYSGGSGAFVHNIPILAYGHAMRGLVEFFGYSSNVKGIDRKHYDDSTWTALVLRELDARRPILYAGGDETSGGHCFVCDGYDAENRGHFNWGWSGEGDGFYALNHLAPGVGGTGGGTGTYDFSNQQQMLTDLKPHEGLDDFGPSIRQFPYTQDFESAPVGWDASTAGDYYYSWYVYDTTGCQGNYSALVFGYQRGNSTDTLKSPYIVTPGEYTLQWEERTLNNTSAAYKVILDTATLFDTSFSNTAWQQHEASFTIHEGDSLRIQFIYYGSQARGTLMIDNVHIESTSSPIGIDHASFTDIAVYPNPTTGMVFFDTEALRTELYDLQGKRLLSAEHKSSLDLNFLPRGTYFLRTTTSDGVSLRKIIKK